MPPDQRRTAHCYDLNCGPNGSMTDVQWSPDGSHLAFVSVSRDHKVAWLRIADAATGAVRNVIREQVATFYESASGWAQDAVNWRYLPASHEVIWFSQRDDWGHLYLYDPAPGGWRTGSPPGAGMSSSCSRPIASAACFTSSVRAASRAAIRTSVPLQGGLRRPPPAAADPRAGQPCGLDRPIRPLFSGQLLDARHAAGDRTQGPQRPVGS